MKTNDLEIDFNNIYPQGLQGNFSINLLWVTVVTQLNNV